MKTAKFLVIKLFVAVAMLLLANQSRALTTPYLIQLSNDVAGYQAYLSLDPTNAPEIRALGRALRDLTKPTETVAQDYARYFVATLHLGKFAFSDPVLTAGGVVAFTNFMTDAAIQTYVATLQNEALNPFVRAKKPASNLLAQVAALLQANAVETNLTTGLLRGNLIFSKLVKAQKLVAKGQANQGFAPDDTNLSGGTVEYTQRDEEGTIQFTDDTNYTQTTIEETTAGTYTYTRTGLNTAIIVLTEIGGSTTTVKTTFKSLGDGRYSLKFEGPDETGRSAGRFTFSRP